MFNVHLKCTFRASCCSARLSRAGIIALQIKDISKAAAGNSLQFLPGYRSSQQWLLQALLAELPRDVVLVSFEGRLEQFGDGIFRALSGQRNTDTLLKVSRLKDVLNNLETGFSEPCLDKEIQIHY